MKMQNYLIRKHVCFFQMKLCNVELGQKRSKNVSSILSTLQLYLLGNYPYPAQWLEIQNLGKKYFNFF